MASPVLSAIITATAPTTLTPATCEVAESSTYPPESRRHYGPEED